MKMLLAVLFALFPAFASAAPVPSFNMELEATSVYFSEELEMKAQAPASIEGHRLVRVVNINSGCPVPLKATFDFKMQSNIMTEGQTAYLTLHITPALANEATATECERTALARYQPINLDMDMEVGTYALDIRNPAHPDGLYMVTVKYEPI